MIFIVILIPKPYANNLVSIKNTIPNSSLKRSPPLNHYIKILTSYSMKISLVSLTPNVDASILINMAARFLPFAKTAKSLSGATMIGYPKRANSLSVTI